MSVHILTMEDLQNFKIELFAELKKLLQHSVPDQKKWLKTDEVKKLLKISSGTLQTLRINGTLQYTKVGGILYYDFEYIQKLLQGNLRSPNN